MPQAKSRSSIVRSPHRPDPVFALIAAHKKAEKAHCQAVHRLGLVERKAFRPEANNYKIPPPNNITSSSPKFYFRNAYDFGDNKDIEKHVQRYLQDAASHFGPRVGARIKKMQAEAERELRPMLKAHIQEHFRRRDRAGITAVEQVVKKCEDACSAAMRELCQTKPRTAAGLVALIKYLQPEYEDGDLNSFYDGRANGLFKTLASAVSNMQAA